MKKEGFLVLLGLLGGLAQVSEQNVVPLEAAFQGKQIIIDLWPKIIQGTSRQILGIKISYLAKIFM